MEKRIVLGKRILNVRCSDECNPKIYKSFFALLEKYEGGLIELMDEYVIPEEVLVNLRGGESELEGFYYKHDKDTSENLVVIDIFTKHIDMQNVEKSLLDVFVHEIVHHLVADEKETKKTAEEFIRGL